MRLIRKNVPVYRDIRQLHDLITEVHMFGSLEQIRLIDEVATQAIKQMDGQLNVHLDLEELAISVVADLRKQLDLEASATDICWVANKTPDGKAFQADLSPIIGD